MQGGEMKSDRELLELAAKAAGYVLLWGDVYSVGGDEVDCSDIPYIKSTEPDVNDMHWDPLTDDGDALRLAVMLHMTVRCYMGTTVAQIGTPGLKSVYEEVTNHADPAEATRRAIVRAAAYVWEVMP
jgi:hypothetical protein